MWMLTINCIYSAPSLVLYLSTAIVIILNWKTMKSSFFIWYLFDFAMNICTMFFTFINLKFASATCPDCLLAPLYRSLQGTFASKVLYSLMYHMSYVQYSTTAIISINRLSIIVDHYKYEPLWRKYSFILMLLVALGPIAVNMPIFSSECTWGSRSDETFVLTCDVPQSRLYTPLIFFQVFCIVCSILCNVISFAIVYNATTDTRKRLELNFTILISITTLVQLAGTVITIVLNGNSNTSTYTFVHTYILPFISDGFTVMHPWLLVVLSKPVRNHLRRVISRQEKTSVEVIPPHNSATGAPRHPANQHASHFSRVSKF